MILIALLAIGLLGMVIAQVASTELAISANVTAGTRAFLPADGASQVLLRDVAAMSRQLGRFPTAAEMSAIPTPSFAEVSLTRFLAAPVGAQVTGPISSGLYVGLSGLIQPFEIEVTAESPGPPQSRATVEIHGDFAAIPIFQFGVLYENDLGLHPGPPMTLSGRIHSNSDVWIDPSQQLWLEDPLTAAGKIYNRRPAGWAAGGDVQIRDAEGVYQGMGGLDSEHPDWTTEALSRWDGRVRSAEIGGDRLDLVIEDPADPRILVRPAAAGDGAPQQAAKLWYEADLRIVNGQGFDDAGNPISLIDPLTGTRAIRETVLYDWREERSMLAVEVDVEKLGRLPGFPADGVLYVGAFEPGGGMPAWPGGQPGVGPAAWSAYATPWSGTGTTEFAVKLANGATLPAPLTVVTDNPLYVHGNYNTVNKRGAALMADAVTILSNDWGDVDGDGIFDSDLDYSLQDLSLRTASSTTVNAAIMAGDVDMGLSDNGGVANLARLLEHWSGAALTLRGSLTALWRSEHADGTFGGAGVYTAPVRNWAFDPAFLDLANLPPATPRVYQITVTSWEHR